MPNTDQRRQQMIARARASGERALSFLRGETSEADEVTYSGVEDNDLLADLEEYLPFDSTGEVREAIEAVRKARRGEDPEFLDRRVDRALAPREAPAAKQKEEPAEESEPEGIFDRTIRDRIKERKKLLDDTSARDPQSFNRRNRMIAEARKKTEKGQDLSEEEQHVVLQALREFFSGDIA